MKTLFIHGAALALAMMVATGCHTHTSNLSTATGKPTVKLHESDLKNFQTSATAYFKQRGYVSAEADFLGVPGTIAKVDDLVFEKPNRQASNLIGSPSCARIYLNPRRTADGYVIISGDTFQVGNCHTPFENVVASRSRYSSLQWDMNQIARHADTSARGSGSGVASLK